MNLLINIYDGYIFFNKKWLGFKLMIIYYYNSVSGVFGFRCMVCLLIMWIIFGMDCNVINDDNNYNKIR